MTFAQAIQSVFAEWNNFSGRARRSEFWFFHLFFWLFCGVVEVIMIIFDISNLVLFQLVIFFGFLIPSLSVTFRRLHDTGHSGWRLLWAFFPVIGGVILFIDLVKESIPEENGYGLPP